MLHLLLKSSAVKHYQTEVNQLCRMKKCSSCKKFSVLDPLSMKPNTAAFITLFDKISKIRPA
jgi:hypothetical protein